MKLSGISMSCGAFVTIMNLFSIPRIILKSVSSPVFWSMMQKLPVLVASSVTYTSIISPISNWAASIVVPLYDAVVLWKSSGIISSGKTVDMVLVPSSEGTVPAATPVSEPAAAAVPEAREAVSSPSTLTVTLPVAGSPPSPSRTAVTYTSAAPPERDAKVIAASVSLKVSLPPPPPYSLSHSTTTSLFSSYSTDISGASPPSPPPSAL